MDVSDVSTKHNILKMNWTHLPWKYSKPELHLKIRFKAGVWNPILRLIQEVLVFKGQIWKGKIQLFFP